MTSQEGTSSGLKGKYEASNYHTRPMLTKVFTILGYSMSKEFRKLTTLFDVRQGEIVQ